MDKLSKWFSVMLVPKLLLTPIKIRFFGPKTAKFGPKYAFLVIFCPRTTKFGIFVHCRLIWCPVGGLVGGCGARAVSCKTPIYFIIRGEILAKHSRSDPTDFKDSRKRKWVGGPAQLWAGKALTSPSVAPQDRIPGPQLPPVITPQRTFSKSKYDLK